MKSFALAACLMLVAFPSFAKAATVTKEKTVTEVTITLSAEEQKAYLTILDQAVRAGGLQSVPTAWKFVQKLQAAAAAAGPVAPDTSPPEPVKP